jgi:hypothetical protein
MGVPVMDDRRHGGEFWFDAEKENASKWFSYHNHNKAWGDWKINDKVHEVLGKYDLHCEWENSAIIIVYQD